ncbi:bifunctional serine/threonine-protein kinase/formylglycine-generating enzyme family protein [Coralloluteibacterium thermophilus]|uniref:Bifunctional serine/threonine-protein kinase/formylglycine-generating enzyme family protein n=1 Tax=Coralloluteibacterium thermophilum TaxID=2707049 RepID=A0ABV9NMB8_9GAMM
MDDASPASARPEPTEPPRIDGYRVIRLVGEGGMARVWLAEQVSLGREVAIKVIAPEALADESARERFEQEARTIARLAHPSIVAIHEVGRTADGLIYYVMPYLGHGDLSQRDLGGDPARILAVLRPLLQALGYAHAQGVVHRDVKAENVLFDGADRPLLADFGIALARRDLSRISQAGRITSAGLLVGSGAAMAPEQARGDAVDGRADLYSVGVMLYELLTGHPPYRGDDPLALALKHAQAPIPRLPPEHRAWQPIIDRALAKAPESRFPTAAAMLAEIEYVADTGNTRQGQQRRVRRRLMLGALAGVLVLLVALRVLLWPSTEAAADTAPGAEAPRDEGPPAETADMRLLAFEEQLARDRLTRQPGDNAAETLYAAWQLAPEDPRIPDALNRLLDRLGVHVRQQVARGADEDVRAAFGRARTLAVGTGNGTSEHWRRFKLVVVDALEARIGTAADRYDRRGAEAGIALLRELDLATPESQDVIDRAAALPTPGAALQDPGGPPLVFVLPGAAPVAVARSEVARSDYARFAEATGRTPANCPGRGPLRVFDRRSWVRPGFEQGAGHPVVCVSWHDANAYARWLSERTGQRYRLPTLAEWRQLARLARAPAAAANGTRPAGGASRDALGLLDLGGNVAEWLADGSGNGRLTGGRSWRDPASVPLDWTGPQDPERGFDDVGFRLVRELGPADLERFER